MSKTLSKTHAKYIHIGNQGEHIVATKLSANCIVRDVGQGKDTGIDLYCEILNDKTRELSLHFFCQVKTARKGMFDESKIRKYLEYWGNQPVPVFVVVVEYTEENDIQGDYELWVYDIPLILAKKDARDREKSEPARDVGEKFQLCSESNNKDKMSLQRFIDRHVPWSHGLWQLRRFGLVLPNPEIKEKDEILVCGFTYIYEEDIAKAAHYAKLLLEKDKYNRNGGTQDQQLVFTLTNEQTPATPTSVNTFQLMKKDQYRS